jgi:hypothetical protein
MGGNVVVGVGSASVKKDCVSNVGLLLLLLLRLQIRQGNNPAFQFKTHPNIDKAGYGNGVLGLKDPSRPFPTGNSMLLCRPVQCVSFSASAACCCWFGVTVLQLRYQWMCLSACETQYARAGALT